MVLHSRAVYRSCLVNRLYLFCCLQGNPIVLRTTGTGVFRGYQSSGVVAMGSAIGSSFVRKTHTTVHYSTVQCSTTAGSPRAGCFFGECSCLLCVFFFFAGSLGPYLLFSSTRGSVVTDGAVQTSCHVCTYCAVLIPSKRSG